ncbi:hypothetical protein D6853_09515 [Butyrivibrio sp. X503]|uniref:hypothetical protein n=1 Tax=Butyrivibrio sp. X503 TaxID=2364878 RepID=UPI000EA86015|nr:hypothetical protein [Butyrivibrio sp. X503]RKM55773.1 hypothetical protein D6853_09515 [Butyrivibrio sp. X503]
MFIKYDEYELNNFFEKEPISIGNVSSGEFIYSYMDCDFKLVMTVLVYEQIVSIAISYCKKTICNIKIAGIDRIESGDDALYIYTNENKVYVLKKKPIVGLIQE